MLACVSVYQCVHVRESVPQYGPRPPGLCTSVYVCTVRTHKGFLQCAGARPPGLCISVYFSAVRAQTAFVRCESTKALCFGVLYELQELCAVRTYKDFVQWAPGLVLLCTVRAPRYLRGASLQRLCASVYCTSPTSFVRCEPTKALHSVRQGLCFCVLYEPQEPCAVRAYKGFIQCAGARPPGFAPSPYVLVRLYEQMSSCTRTCTYVLYELTRYLGFCTRICMPVCRGTKHSRGTSTPACVVRIPPVKNYTIGTGVKT